MATNIHSDSLITNMDALASVGSSTFSGSAVGNIQQGGQLGLGPRVMQMDGATPLPLNACTIVLLQAPTMWRSYSFMQQVLKSLFELHARNVDGIDFGYNMDFSEVLVGHDSQQASMPTINKRTAVNPSFTWDEVYGNLVWSFHNMWLRQINHPDTCASLLSALQGDSMPAWVWTTFSASFIAIQPDPTGLPNRIVDAAVYTCVTPQETGQVGFKRTIGEATVPQRTINYKAVVVHNDNTKELGRIVMNAINAHKPNYDYATTFDGVDGSLTSYGLNQAVSEAISEFQKPVSSGSELASVLSSISDTSSLISNAGTKLF